MEPISVASGASYFSTPDPVKQAAVAAINQNHTFYGPVEGLLTLRQAIAGKYTDNLDWHASADQVLITPGTKLALHIIFSVLLQPGDEVLIPCPAWFGFQELLKYSNGKFVPLNTSASEDFELAPEALRKAITPKTRILVLSNPNNPTGKVYSRQELKELVKVLDDFPEVYIVSDEIYDQVTFTNPICSLYHFRQLHNRLLVVNGFSKSYAMSGWRVGYIVASKELIRSCLDFQHATISGVSPINQEAALAAWQQREELYQPLLQILKENRAQIMAFFKGHQISFPVPEGAYYIFPDFSEYISRCFPEKTKGSTEKFFDRLKSEAGVEVIAGDKFGAPGFARISFAIEPENLKEVLHRLDVFLRKLN